ncbi:MAG: MerR family transcriptional regulator [Fluviicola sp.]|nr:MerR family transcriptional regulator [Fluviicola sp.]
MAEYKIKDVEILTGIKAHTIRIWEKRYRLLTPSRTDTQIRTYTDAELTALINIAMLNKQGIKISRIAEMTDKEIANKVVELSNYDHGETHIDQMILSLIQLDESLFRNTLTVLIKKIGLIETYQQYVIPFLERIGVMWLVGSINPAQEHFISNLIRQRLISELELLPPPDPSKPLVILFLPEHEWHELGLLFYHYHLRQKGIRTIYLGQSLPYASLLESIRSLKPKWILTSWIASVDSKYIHHYFDRLKNDAPDVVVIAGGYQIKEHFELIQDNVKGFRLLSELDSLIEETIH